MDSAATIGSTVSVSALLGNLAPSSSTTRRRTATATGNAPPLYIMNSGPAGPLAHLPDELQPTPSRVSRPRPAPPAAATPALADRRSARCLFRPTVTTQNLWELLSYGSRLLLVTR